MQRPNAMSELEREVRRLLEDYAAGSLDRIEDWDGRTLEDLARYLTPEEYEMLVDSLRGPEEDA